MLLNYIVGGVFVELLTIPKIASLIGVPESNLRYYRSKFLKYIPEVADGKHRRYKPESVEIFKFIADSYKAGSSSDFIENELKRRFAVTVEVEEDPQQDDTKNQQMELFRQSLIEDIQKVIREEIITAQKELSAAIENKFDELIMVSRKERHKKKGFFSLFFKK